MGGLMDAGEDYERAISLVDTVAWELSPFMLCAFFGNGMVILTDVLEFFTHTSDSAINYDISTLPYTVLSVVKLWIALSSAAWVTTVGRHIRPAIARALLRHNRQLSPELGTPTNHQREM